MRCLIFNPSVHFYIYAPGSTAQFQQQFGQIVQYLNAGGVSGPIAQLEARPEVVHVLEVKNTTPQYLSVERGDDTIETRVIIIDPLLGGEVGSGKVQTPALIFLHEASHALQDVRDPQQYRRDVAAPDPQYDTREERRVIVGVETPAAKRLREPSREHHRGELVPVQCPICAK